MNRDRLRAELDDAIDVDTLVADAGLLIAAGPDELAAQATVAEIAARLGLEVQTYEEDLAAVRRLAGYPGEEVDRDRLVNVTATSRGREAGAPRLCLSGHVDVVPPGDRPWTTPPFVPHIAAGRLHGRGAADMRAGVVAGLHAVAAVAAVVGAPRGDVVVHCVSGEEDGGVGAFALLQRDHDFAGCVIAEPTDGAIVCAHAGALTWRTTVGGRAAHASDRLAGVSALDRFLPIYQALQELEHELNRDVTHPLMREHRLPYPLSVGKVTAGDWASTVPDLLVFEGRVGVPVGTSPQEVRDCVERCIRDAADDRGDPPTVEWNGGQFAPSETPTDDPLVLALADEVAAVTGTSPRLDGVTYGADMRFYRERGIPTVMFGPGELHEAHATDESVAVDDVVRHARALAALAAQFGE